MRSVPLASLALLLVACSRELTDQQLIEKSVEAERRGPALLVAGHDGPGVAHGQSGPARFAGQVLAAFSADRALETVRFADGFYRAPANAGFEAVLDHVVARLADAGYVGSVAPDASGAVSATMRLDVLVTPRKTPAWTPRSARLAIVGADGRETPVHVFDDPADPERTMLPVNAPSASVAGRLVTALERVEAGDALLVSDALDPSLLEAARARGAVLVLSDELAPFNVDPKKGGERHLDAIGFRSVPPGTTMPVAQVSPRAGRALRAAVERAGGARVRFDCEVTFEERPLRTVVATLVGATKPAECVAAVAHVQEPGACDNASGVGTLVEAARVLAQLVDAGELPRPARSVCFVFGDEMAQSRVFLERGDPIGGVAPRCIAAIAADMTGESRERTGAIALLERAPDPAAVRPLAPDRHTAWLGARANTATASWDEVVPDGLATLARCALIDVGALQKDWATSEHPHEGGSDHVVFQQRGVSSFLLWHFPDFAYHTSLDRMDHVDGEEMRRTGTALLAALLALADPRPGDLDRYLRSLRAETDVRVRAAEAAGDEELAFAWRAWSTGARLWLRALCLDQPFPPREPLSKTIGNRRPPS